MVESIDTTFRIRVRVGRFGPPSAQALRSTVAFIADYTDRRGRQQFPPNAGVWLQLRHGDKVLYQHVLRNGMELEMPEERARPSVETPVSWWVALSDGAWRCAGLWTELVEHDYQELEWVERWPATT